MRSIAFRALSRIGVAVAALMLFLPSASAFTGGNGRIAFSSRFPDDGSGTDYEIVSIDRGGEDAITLTSDRFSGWRAVGLCAALRVARMDRLLEPPEQ